MRLQASTSVRVQRSLPCVICSCSPALTRAWQEVTTADFRKLACRCCITLNIHFAPLTTSLSKRQLLAFRQNVSDVHKSSVEACCMNYRLPNRLNTSVRGAAVPHSNLPWRGPSTLTSSECSALRKANSRNSADVRTYAQQSVFSVQVKALE